VAGEREAAQEEASPHEPAQMGAGQKEATPEAAVHMQ